MPPSMRVVPAVVTCRERTAHNEGMNDTAPATPTPAAIRPGQVWLSSNGTGWTVERRRGRAFGPVENLIVSPGGARRWLTESELRDGYTHSAS